MARWRIQLLGGMGVHDSALAGSGADGSFSSLAFPTKRSALILARTALARTGSVGRDEMAEALWPEDLLDSTRVRLRQELKRLKSCLGKASEVLAVDRSSIRLNGEAAEVDARIFHQTVQSALLLPPSPERTAMLERGVALYGGPLLPEFGDLWTFGVRLEMRALFDQASSALLAAREEAQEWKEASALASRILSLDPLKEQAVASLMKALLALGDQPGALAVFGQFEKAREKAGKVRVSGEASELARKIRRTSLKAAAVQPPPLSEPVVKASDLAPLPQYRDEFLGREEELRTIREALLQPQAGRLVTLVGPGGVGKTRISVEAAASLEHEAGPVIFLQVEPEPGADVAEKAAAAAPHQGPFLALLDNCEAQLEEAARGAQALLERFPQARILATSRQRLGLGEERVVTLKPFEAPIRAKSLAEAMAFPAVRLFVERATRADSSFQVGDEDASDLVRLASHLDGLPLALELAAARVGGVGLREAVDEIDDRFSWLVSRRVDVPDRQQSLWAAIDWSWRGLDERARSILKIMAFPRGGAALGLVRALAGEDCRAEVDLLVERSLASSVRSGREVRLRLLDSVREFVKRQEGGPDPELLKERLARWVEERLDEWGVVPSGPSPVEAHPLLFAEQENIHQAIEAAASLDGGLAVDIAARMGPFWMDLGKPREGLAVLTSLLSHPLPPVQNRARCEFFAGRMAALIEDLPLSSRWLAQGAATAREAGIEGLARLCDLNQTAADLDLGRLEECLAGTLAAADWYRAQGQHPGILLVALCQAGMVQAMMGRFDEAAASHEEALALSLQLALPHLTLRVYRDMAWAAAEEGDVETGASLSAEALALLAESPSLTMEIWVRLGLASLLLDSGRVEEAREQIESLDRLAADIQGPKAKAGHALLKGRLAMREGRLGEGAALTQEALRGAMASGRPGPMVEGIVQAAELLLEGGRADKAGSLAATVLQLKEAWVSPSLRRRAESALAEAGAPPSRPAARLTLAAVKAASELSSLMPSSSQVSRPGHGAGAAFSS